MYKENCIEKLQFTDVIVFDRRFSIRGILFRNDMDMYIVKSDNYSVSFSKDEVEEMWRFYSDSPWKIALKNERVEYE